MDERSRAAEEDTPREIGGNWFILIGAVPALAVLLSAAAVLWYQLSAAPQGPVPPPPAAPGR